MDIKNIEIFKTGTWNGHKITEKILDDIVYSFSKIGSKIKPFLKLGHNDEQELLQKDGMPSAGWVTNLKKVGTSLFADFNSIPEKVATLIENKAYGRMSIELFNNLIDTENDTKYNKVLKAVALLGGDTPAVLSLDDMIDLYTDDSIKYDTIETYNNLETEDFMSDDKNVALQLENEKLKNTNENLKKELVTVTDDFTKKLDEKTKEVETIEFLKKETEVKAFIESAVKDGKVTPAQVESYTKLAMSDGVLLFSKDGEDKTQFETIKELIGNSEPVVNFEDTTHETEVADPELSDDDGSKLMAKAEKYALDNKVDYKDALIIVGKEEEK